MIKDGQLLRKCSPRSRWYYELGDYYAVSMPGNVVVAKHLDLAKIAYETGVISAVQMIVEG
jgi:hypothetical protein